MDTNRVRVILSREGILVPSTEKAIEIGSNFIEIGNTLPYKSPVYVPTLDIVEPRLELTQHIVAALWKYWIPVEAERTAYNTYVIRRAGWKREWERIESISEKDLKIFPE